MNQPNQSRPNRPRLTRRQLLGRAGALGAAKRAEDLNYEGASGDVNLKDDGSVNSGFVIWKVEQAEGAVPSFVTKGTIKFSDL